MEQHRAVECDQVAACLRLLSLLLDDFVPPLLLCWFRLGLDDYPHVIQ
jgi:hypothetical protein